jgi:pyrroline-5-carboxylate reductase
MILTKLIEVSSSFNNMRILVSTRQPHLLRPFKQEFGIETEFNNDRVFAECDIIFICVLPGQAAEMFKDVRFVLQNRFDRAEKDSKVSKPLIVSCLAATGIPKL